MGYTLIIGNMNGGKIAAVTLDQAPAISGDYNPRTNKRQPSYSDWKMFCKAVGLYEIFYAPRFPLLLGVILNIIYGFQCNGLIVQHPGVAPLTWRHAQAITIAKIRYKQAHPQAQPRYDCSQEDEHMARLVWLEWWMKWALEHCQYPGIENR